MLARRPLIGLTGSALPLAKLRDDPTRYADAKARRNYAGTSPMTHQAGKPASRQEEDRPGPLRAQRPALDALAQQAFAALIASPVARAYYDQQRTRGIGHHAALRQLGNRLVGILHAGTLHDETTAWQHRQQHSPAATS
ncbi:transposase [Micromonospora sp. L31]|uniref:transposase n=1 Tax=Micromonospora sp. L31 TaxID=3452213 RepID=UPI003F8A454D